LRDGLADLFGRRIAQAEDKPQPLWELASVFVEDEWRGRGIGASIVRRLLEQHQQQDRALDDLYLLTLAPTASWYERFGFRTVESEQVPLALAFEVQAGEAISALLGNQLVAMRGEPAQQSLDAST
jgi:N-acetylglutamate synthase-like GNAT family acetyltransferase